MSSFRFGICRRTDSIAAAEHRVRRNTGCVHGHGRHIPCCARQPDSNCNRASRSTPVAAVHPAVLNSASNCDAPACDNRLDAELKLRKVLRELRFNEIPNSGEHNLPLRSLVAEFFDGFSEADDDVGSMDLIFQEIETGDAHQLR